MASRLLQNGIWLFDLRLLITLYSACDRKATSFFLVGSRDGRLVRGARARKSSSSVAEAGRMAPGMAMTGGREREARPWGDYEGQLWAEAVLPPAARHSRWLPRQSVSRTSLCGFHFVSSITPRTRLLFSYALIRSVTLMLYARLCEGQGSDGFVQPFL